MPNYSNSKIYRLFCENDEYIGSTTRPLSERMYEHRKMFKAGKTSTTSYLIFAKHGLDNVKIELIEDCPCENKEHLLKREGEIQRERKCVNLIIAGRSHAEWEADNAEQVKKQKHEYYMEHREHHTARFRQYYQEHREQIAEYSKQYQLDNADRLREYRRQYYLNKTSC